MPWTPDDSLRGAKRDSVINFHLTTPAKSVSRTYDGYGRNYVWNNGSGLLSHIRLSDPDSNKIGKEFKIASLSVDEYNPTFKFRKLRGDVRILGDSVWLDLPHFELPASFGHAKGKVWWGSDLPVRYDIAVRGDSVSLDDVNWVYATLPRTGGGTVDLGIKNDPANLHVVDFRLQNMDMRTTGSHLTGEMWFGTGAPELLIRHVNLKADPVSFDFIRALNGKPFPYDWRGDIFGTVRARGGTSAPLRHRRCARHVPGCARCAGRCRASPATARSTFSIRPSRRSIISTSTPRPSTCARSSSSTRTFRGSAASCMARRRSIPSGSTCASRMRACTIRTVQASRRM